MTDTPVTSLSSIQSCTISDDGKQAIIHGTGDQGDASVIIAESLLQGLIVALTGAFGRSRHILGDDPDNPLVFGVSEFRTGASKQHDVVLEFELPEGAQLAFLLQKRLAESLGEALLVAAGRPPLAGFPTYEEGDKH